ncbi:MAG: hypothetical protein M3159_04305 [Actinomycetota bacterium]|nr:hypothetical protein [Actinomycetota bacterium]
MKKMLAALGLGALIVGIGAGAVAWADPGGGKAAGPNAAKRKAAQDCLKQAKAANKDATPTQVLDAAKPCLQQAGLAQAQLDKLAKAAAARDCVQQAKKDNPDATRSQLLDLAKPCLQQAGVAQNKLDRAAKRIQCRKQANIDHPDATALQLRAAVKACVGAA